MHIKGISIFSRFSKNITRFVLAELDLAIDARKSGDTNTEFKHLENAHVLGQESTYWHVKVHVLMLLWALRNLKFKECFGQLFRIVGAVLTTTIGLVPQGNTGGSNVSPFKVMPIEHEYQIMINDARSDT